MKEQEIKDLLEKVRHYIDNDPEIENSSEYIQKFSSELTNSSTFEKSMSSLLDVDIYKGITELINLTKNKKCNEESAFKDSGIEFVSNRIKHYLISSQLAKNVLVEYSLLSSTLNPENPDKLQCCSFVIDKDNTFKEFVERWYTACINYTADKDKGKGFSIYQHPHFLYDIKINVDEEKKDINRINFIKGTFDYYDSQDGLTITKKSGEGKSFKNIISDSKNNIRFSPIKDGQHSDTFIQAFSLDRKFNEMLANAKKLEETGVENLYIIQSFLHDCCHSKITRRNEAQDQSYYVSFPIYGSRSSNQLNYFKIESHSNITPLQGIGACFIYFEPNLDGYKHFSDKYDELVLETINKLSYEIGKFVRLISSNYLFNLGLNLQENARKEAVRSTKAAIMSRNMSHNLGSHVMAYLKHHLSSVRDMLNDKILSQIFENEQELTDLVTNPSVWEKRGFFNSINQNEDGKVTIDANQIALPFLVGVGQFISYLQERQDFIATIATDYVPYFSSVNFKDFVYDELNNDKRYQRHPDRKNLKPDNILLGNIARSEGLGRVTSPTNNGDNKTLCDIVLKFRNYFTGDPVEVIESAGVYPKDYYDESIIEKAREDLNIMRDFDVSLPGGVVGRQAIFSIIENVIRNAAKHGNWREKGKLELTIDVFTKEDLLSHSKELAERLRNDDNVEGELSLKEVLEKFYKNAANSDDLFFITLTDNLIFSKESLCSLRKAIIEHYIDDFGRMINANKGIKEMRISAAWLRSIEDNLSLSVMTPDNCCEGDKKWLKRGERWTGMAPILYARISKDRKRDKKGHLQYIFCLNRPQKVALISRDIDMSTSKRTSEALISKSWKIFTPESFINHSNKSFEFIIFDDTIPNYDKMTDDYNSIRRLSSSNIYKLGDMTNDVITNVSDIIRKIRSNHSKKKLTEQLEKTLNLLYLARSQWDGQEMIYIDDIKAKIEWEKLSSEEKSLTKDKLTFAKDTHAKYRYVTHLEEKNEFREYVIESNDNHFAFSEGITGNNSTDRLVRNEKLTDLWFFKHLYAMKQKIAIFDERLFSKAYGVEETDFVINVIMGFGKNLDFDKKFVINEFPQHERQIKAFKNYEELNHFLEKKKYNPSKGTNREKVKARSHLGATYAHKGVFIFSLIRSMEHPKVFYLYGFKHSPKTNCFTECIKYAEFSWNKRTLKITPCQQNMEILSGYNTLSIHQGLLDKLYDAFDIKGDCNSQDKEVLTREFYKFFVNDKFIEFKDENINHYFLPGMTIHSGRSKPSKYDMPQRLPFIQYSAIEHAVLDCKYSLVELLKSARYE